MTLELQQKLWSTLENIVRITKKKLVYTVFYDTGDWAWVKDADDETMYVGTSVTLGSEWGGEHPISQSFLEYTKTWLMSFGKFSNYSEV